MSEKSLDFFLDNPELKSRHLRAIPTLEMYRFFPPEDEIITIEASNPQKNYRYIFNGCEKTEFEKKKLAQFYDYESKSKKIDYPLDWRESDTMRILQAVDYDIKKAYNSIIENILWLENIPRTINDKIIDLLNSGLMYVHGRDHHFRPVIFVQIKKVKTLLNDNYNFYDLNQSIIYLMNYVMEYLLIPGQIENWIMFVDFDGVGLTDVGDFQKILSTLTKRRGRVFKNYFVNISTFLKFSIKAIIKVVSSVAKKTIILGQGEINKVNELISPDNLEQKYGGNAPDLTPGGNNLFPPIMPNANYALNGETLNIVTPEEYKNMCIGEGKRPYVICPEYQKIWDEEKRNKEKQKIYLGKNTKHVDKNTDDNNKNDNNDIITTKNNNFYDDKEFMKEFEGINNVNFFEERKYNVPSKINIKEINTFFKQIYQNHNFVE